MPKPDFGVFPETLHELVGNRVQLNRLLGLSNLYYIDPEDQEILQELRQVRLSLIEAIERCPEGQLQKGFGLQILVIVIGLLFVREFKKSR